MSDPGSKHGMTPENLLAALPAALRGDPSAAALGQITASILARRPEEIDLLRIYPAIDRLPADLLDILARDFKVDWWDADYSLEEKRRTLKGSWKVHKTLGTRMAIETALRAIYPVSTAEPWFLYDGEPYHFRILIDLTAEKWAEGKPWRAMELVQYYQSLRDRLDGIEYTMILPPATLQIGGGVGLQPSIAVPLQPDEYDFRGTLHAGGTGGIQSSLGGLEDTAPPERQSVVHTGGGVSAQSELQVPEDTAPPSRTTILRTGGVCTIISNISPEEE